MQAFSKVINNVTGLVKTAKTFGIPTILTLPWQLENEARAAL